MATVSTPSLAAPPSDSVSLAQTIDTELSALERGELRSQDQVNALFSLLQHNATREQIARAARWQILTTEHPLARMPVLCIQIESAPNGAKNVKYYEVSPEFTCAGDDLNPVSRDSILFHPDRIPKKLLGEVRDARLLTPSLLTLQKHFTSPYQMERLLHLVVDQSRITYQNGIPETWDGRYVDHTAWSKNIDTVYGSDWLKSSGILNGSVKRSLEVGCGSGGISQTVISFCPNLETHHFTDIDPHAINATRRNLRPLSAGINVSWLIGKGVPAGGRYDLIVANPPYLPTPDGDGDKDHYSGTKLIKRLFEDGIKALNPDNPDACICVQISSLTLPDFERYQREHPEVEVTPISPQVQVPLRILGVLRQPEMLTYLKEHCGLRDTPDPDYHFPYEIPAYTDPDEPRQYFHRIMAFKLTPRR